MNAGSPKISDFNASTFDGAERRIDIRRDRLVGSSATATGREAPNFSLRALGGTEVSLEAMHGKVVLLNFWASWCGPCHTEMPSLEELYRDFSVYRDFALLTVNTEERGARSAENFIAKHGYDFPLLLDAANATGAAYGVSALPSTFVIDRDGRIVWKHSGALDWSDATLRYGLKRLLKKEAPEKKQPRSIGTIEARLER